MKFLLDANLSPETARFLRRFSFDVKSLIEEGKAGFPMKKCYGSVSGWRR